MSKKTVIILFLLFTILPIKSYAQVSNAGFVPGNIWYSIDPFEEGDKIKIYTLIFNPDERELSGTVVFFDNNIFLGKKDFIALAKGVKDISIDWMATVGAHNIFGKIENAKFLVSKGKYEEVYLAENETSKSSRTVSKKIILKTTNISENPDSIIDSVSSIGSESIKNIEKVIEEKTPEFITKPVILTTNTIEKLRSDTGTFLKEEKETVQNQIKALNNAKTSGDTENTEASKFLKPFKYTELFFFTFLSFIFNNKFIFYIILAFIIFFLLRYIWHFVF